MHKSIADAKPLVGFLGIVSTLMATGGSWGLIMYTGYPWQSINLASLFLILGVGLDDTFVMLSSWSRTPKTASVPERMRLCYDEAIMSITITNLTNLVSFAVGVAVPGFKCVEIFSVYTGVGLLFVRNDHFG
jgi:predicted RND superfamily exporter protein